MLPPSKIEVKTQRNAVTDPTINICMPYFIILPSLILAKNIPNNNNIIKVIIIDEKKAVFIATNPRFTRKNRVLVRF